MEAGIHQPGDRADVATDDALATVPHRRARRVGLAILMTLIGVNIWTGGPLLALWIGSRVQSSGSGQSLTIRPVTALTVFAALAVISAVLVMLLRRVSDAYDRLAGTLDTRRRHDSWIADDGHRRGLTAVERMLVVMVAICWIAFEIWFFFFSTSPIDQRSGRSAVPLATPPPAAAPAPPRGAGI
jgi:hypothetical protein